MIKSVTITNPEDESLVLELSNPYDSGLAITSITGLGPNKADVNSSRLAASNGSIFGSASVSSRNVVFNFQLLEDPTTNMVETTRHRAYKYFPLMEQIRIDIETDSRTISIDGYVESVEPDIFNERETIQVSIMCMNPWFYGEEFIADIVRDAVDIEYDEDSRTLGFEITRYINDILYVGDVDAGFEFVLTINGDGLYKSISLEKEDKKITIDTDLIAKHVSRPMDTLGYSVFFRKFAFVERYRDDPNNYRIFYGLTVTNDETRSQAPYDYMTGLAYIERPDEFIHKVISPIEGNTYKRYIALVKYRDYGMCRIKSGLEGNQAKVYKEASTSSEIIGYMMCVEHFKEWEHTGSIYIGWTPIIYMDDDGTEKNGWIENSKIEHLTSKDYWTSLYDREPQDPFAPDLYSHIAFGIREPDYSYTESDVDIVKTYTLSPEPARVFNEMAIPIWPSNVYNVGVDGLCCCYRGLLITAYIGIDKDEGSYADTTHTRLYRSDIGLWSASLLIGDIRDRSTSQSIIIDRAGNSFLTGNYTDDRLYIIGDTNNHKGIWYTYAFPRAIYYNIGVPFTYWNFEAGEELPYDPGGGFTMAVKNGELHIFGGVHTPNNHYKYVEAENKWYYVSTIPYTFYNGTATYDDVEDTFYLIGSEADPTKIYTFKNGAWSMLANSTLKDGDTFDVIIKDDEKKATMLREGFSDLDVTYSIDKNSRFPKFTPGENEFTLTTEETQGAQAPESVDAIIKYRNLYKGV